MGVPADLQLAFRRLRRAPGFSLPVVLVLAVGLALSLSMFGVLRGVLGALPYPGGDRLVAVYAANPQQAVRDGPLTPAEADALARTDALSPWQAFGDFTWGGVTLVEDGRPREITVGVVSAGFFPALGLEPLHGRWFTAEEHAAANSGGSTSIVLSHVEWQRQLGGRPDAVGSTVQTDGGPAVVVGVMPAAFAFPAADVGAWIPRGTFDATTPGYRFQRMLYGVAWLKDGVDRNAVNTWLSNQARAVRAGQGLPDEGWGFATVTVLEELVGNVRHSLWGAFAVALLVLLIACVNVAILLDARQVMQQHQAGIAHALGASRSRLWRQRILELLLLAGAGAGLGIVAAAAALALVRGIAAEQLPRAEAVVLDGTVLGFGVLLVLSVPLLVLAAGRLRGHATVAEVLRTGGRGLLQSSGGARRLLPALAIALSTTSLVAALALTLSLVKLKDVEPGFRSDGVHVMQFFRGGDPALRSPFAEQVRERLLGLPGVEQVSFTTAAPLSTIGSAAEDVRPATRPEAKPVRSAIRRVGPDYLELLQIPLLAGRSISSEDRAGGERVAVINQTLARRSFGENRAVGEQIRLAVGREGLQNYRVVGVMADIRNRGLRDPTDPEVLLSYAQQPTAGISLVLATRTPQPALDRQMAESLWDLAPEQAITRQFTLAADLDAQLQATRFFANVIGVFALCALLLGVSGVYAVAALAQRRRVREFGLKLALGARPVALGGEVLADGLRVVLLGAVLGVAGSVLVLRLLAAQTFGLDRSLTAVTLAGTTLMAIAALLALLLPARRASRTDPMQALRG